MLKKIACFMVCADLLFSPFALQHVVAEESETQTSTPEQTEKLPAVSLMTEAGHIEGYVQLDIGSEKIDASLVKERLGKNYGGVLLLSDIDEGINDSGVISTLRQALPDYGWSVMTVALEYPYKANILLAEQPTIDVGITPPADESQTNPDAMPSDSKQADSEKDKMNTKKIIDNLSRIQTAITYFQQQDIPRLILIGHGQGTLEAIKLLKADEQGAAALISVGLNTDASAFSSLSNSTPILDVLSAKLEPQQVRARKAEMKHLNKNYAQRVFITADRDFSGNELELSGTVAGWLYKQFVYEDDD